MLMQMIDILGPIIIITGIGFAMGRSSLGLDTRSLGTIVIMVATPALIFHTLTSLEVTGDTVRTMSVAALVCVVTAGGLGFLGLRLLGGSVRSFLPPLMLPNSGNMGLPLVLLAFGEAGLQLGVAYFFVVSMLQHTVGLSIYAGALRPSVLLRQPLIYAVASVLIVMWTGIKVPNVIMVTTEILGGVMIPAMLLLLGTSLATLQVSDLGPALFVAVGRLVLGLVSALLAITLLGLQGTAAGIVFLLASMPTAIFNYVLAERFQHNPQQVAGSVVVSTLLTFACLPFLVWIALQIAGGSP